MKYSKRFLVAIFLMLHTIASPYVRIKEANLDDNLSILSIEYELLKTDPQDFNLKITGRNKQHAYKYDTHCYRYDADGALVRVKDEDQNQDCKILKRYLASWEQHNNELIQSSYLDVGSKIIINLEKDIVEWSIKERAIKKDANSDNKEDFIRGFYYQSVSGNLLKKIIYNELLQAQKSKSYLNNKVLQGQKNPGFLERCYFLFCGGFAGFLTGVFFRINKG